MLAGTTRCGSLLESVTLVLLPASPPSTTVPYPFPPPTMREEKLFTESKGAGRNVVLIDLVTPSAVADTVTGVLVETPYVSKVKETVEDPAVAMTLGGSVNSAVFELDSCTDLSLAKTPTKFAFPLPSMPPVITLGTVTLESAAGRTVMLVFLVTPLEVALIKADVWVATAAVLTSNVALDCPAGIVTLD